MTKRFLFFTLIVVLLFSCNKDNNTPTISNIPSFADLDNVVYSIITIDIENEAFEVESYFTGNSNSTYQFPSVVPGVYAYVHTGININNFKAFDENGKEINTTKTNDNQWEISVPENVYFVKYDVSETYEENEFYSFLPAGSSVEDDYAFFNTFRLIGYPHGGENREYYIEIKRPDNSWSLGSSLKTTDQANIYYAENYRELADNPVLTGNLSVANLKVDNCEVGVYVRSLENENAASAYKPVIDEVVSGAGEFIGQIDVNQYNFLFMLHREGSGALEHSYSSAYHNVDPFLGGNSTLANIDPSILKLIKRVIAHEFFHIITPLQIHSQVINEFDFSAADQVSDHLWFYEGITEWASLAILMRSEVFTLEEVFEALESMITNANHFKNNGAPDLITLSKTSYTTGREYIQNIYEAGALVGFLLDIRLLELSDGQKGLRELIQELKNEYGLNNPFDEATFLSTIVLKTYPEIQTFVDAYIASNQNLPIQEYFAKIGIDYDIANNQFSLMSSPSDEQAALFQKWIVNL